MVYHNRTGRTFPWPFVAWDGEGITDDYGAVQRYVLFGNSKKDYVIGKNLSTAECLELLCQAGQKYPNHKHVIFSGNYDVNMMLRDLSIYQLKKLWKCGRVYYRKWKLEWMPGKMFIVKDRATGAHITLYDVFSFFGIAFTKALAQYQAIDKETIAKIQAGKDKRDVFDDSDMDYIFNYWHLELKALVSLMETLQTSLRHIDVYPNMWHGPGAVASFIMKREKVKEHHGPESSDELSEAICNAYSGGRFECFKLGRYRGRVYQYDINSAYPEGVAKLPSLYGCNWTLMHSKPRSIEPWSLYHIRTWKYSKEFKSFRLPKCIRALPQPLFWRDIKQRIYYPSSFKGGWHYGCELYGALECAATYGATLDIDRYYHLCYDDSLNPFGFIPELYAERARWKRANDPAQYVAKIAMNSMYGKMAQQIGSYNGKPPAFHKFEWAGMVTAHTRGKLYQAMMQAPESIIACETDSIFSTVPLDLPISDKLGDWGYNEFDEIIYLQSGLYLTVLDGEVISSKYRGLAPMTYDQAREWLIAQPGWLTQEHRELEFMVNRFTGLGASTKNEFKNWRKWLDITKTVDPIGKARTKRRHSITNCRACFEGNSFWDCPHDLIPEELYSMFGVHSTSKKLEWRKEMDNDITAEFA